MPRLMQVKNILSVKTKIMVCNMDGPIKVQITICKEPLQEGNSITYPGKSPMMDEAKVKLVELTKQRLHSTKRKY